MGWTKVYIQHGKGSNKTAVKLAAYMSKTYRDAGAKDGAAVYYIHIPTVGHLYYLSPQASAMADGKLGEFGEVSEVEEPSLKELSRMQL